MGNSMKFNDKRYTAKLDGWDMFGVKPPQFNI
jgi:hypothetical protein